MEQTTQELILIVDDNSTNIRVLSDLLKDYGFKVLVAKDGESCLQLLEKVAPDLILLDVLMPGIDGFETCRRLKASPDLSDIPVIFMTALSEPVDKLKGLTMGAVDYITKPLQHEEVIARVNVHLKLRSLAKQLKAQTVLLEEQNAHLQQEIRSRQLAESALRLSEEKLALRLSEQKSDPWPHPFPPLDDITQVATCSRFEARLGQAWSQHVQEQSPLSLLLCEVDQFKYFSQTYGQDVSNQYLHAVAQTIVQTTEASAAFVGRYGDSAIGVILPHVDHSQVLQVATSICSDIRQLSVDPAHFEGSASITASLGLASTIPNAETSPATALLMTARKALVVAQTQGGDRYCSHEKDESQDH